MNHYGHVVCVCEETLHPANGTCWTMKDPNQLRRTLQNRLNYAALQNDYKKAAHTIMVWYGIQYNGYPHLGSEPDYIHAKDLKITNKSTAPSRLPKHNSPEGEEVPWEEVRHGQDKKRKNSCAECPSTMKVAHKRTCASCWRLNPGKMVMQQAQKTTTNTAGTMPQTACQSRAVKQQSKKEWNKL